VKRRPAHIASYAIRSRVTPGVLNHRLATPEHAVDERRLTHVRPTDDRDDGEIDTSSGPLIEFARFQCPRTPYQSS
jgi:hypothetical protein